jgi:hypothetical protein
MLIRGAGAALANLIDNARRGYERLSAAGDPSLASLVSSRDAIEIIVAGHGTWGFAEAKENFFYLTFDQNNARTGLALDCELGLWRSPRVDSRGGKRAGGRGGLLSLPVAAEGSSLGKRRKLPVFHSMPNILIVMTKQ